MAHEGQNHWLELFIEFKFDNILKPDLVITEDSRSGFTFYRDLFGNAGIKVIPARAKQNMPAIIKRHLVHIQKQKFPD
jgi:hypothetical protein